eukprot:8213739-Alexandrium_andersonii.AAC.1
MPMQPVDGCGRGVCRGIPDEGIPRLPPILLAAVVDRVDHAVPQEFPDEVQLRHVPVAAHH